MNREQWLSECVQRLRPDFEKAGYPLPEKIRASCSWPSKGGLARKARRLGEAWSATCSESEHCEVFISPVLKDPVAVTAVLVHELVHCVVGVEHGHRGKFPKLARAMGLEGKMTATVAGETLKVRLQEVTDTIGPYPHAKLDKSSTPKSQVCRLLKVACVECGCICRMSRKAIDKVGCPTCACGGQMAEDGVEEPTGV